MSKKIKIDHDIYHRIASINKAYVEEGDDKIMPQDPQDFLDWWWTKANVCSNCFLCENRTQVVKPDGLASAPIMIISQGPAFLEDLSGLPMTGPLELKGSRCGGCLNHTTCYSTKLLSKHTSFGKRLTTTVNCIPNLSGKQELKGKFFLRSAGAILDGIIIDKWKMMYPRQNWIDQYNNLHPTETWEHFSPWFITNVVMCRSTDATKVKENPPDSVPRNRCKKWLAYQWAAVNPKIIVCLGRVALEVLLGSAVKANAVRPNEIIQTRFGPVLFQNHPAEAMREKQREVKGLGYAKVAETLERALDYCGLPI